MSYKYEREECPSGVGKAKVFLLDEIETLRENNSDIRVVTQLSGRN